MEFLAPVMLVGLAGLAIPLIIHLIGRRRAKTVRFAALDFLISSNRKTARRLQLRELLLLAVRALVCLAIPLALAKPYASCTQQGPAVERGPQAAVLIIDDSFAMDYAFPGQAKLLSRAKDHARNILEQLGPEADIAVILAAEGADSPAELTRDHIRLRDSIDDVEAVARPADTTTALYRAWQLLAGSNHERKTVFLMSAMAATGFRDEAPWPPGAGPRLTVVDLTENLPLANLAIVDALVERDPDSGTRGIQVTAELANYGTSGVEEHGISLRITDRVVARGLVTLRPGERLKKRFLATLPSGARSADVIIELDSDPLAVDNRRYVRTQLREEIRVLLVNGDPHTVRHDDELFYLEAALRPGDRADSGTALTTATVDELDEINLGDFDVIILANVRAMSEPRVATVGAWVRDGGGLLIAPGDNVDADAYNKQMQPLMPQTLRDPIDTVYGSRGAERTGRALRLTKWDADHPVFSVFTKDAPGLREARFTKVMLLGPTTRVDERKVLARYTNGAAALVEARSGNGRLMFFTSTVDRDWNDLVIHPGYLPLMQQAVRHLARKQNRRDKEAVLVGRSTVVRVESDDTRIEIHGPSGIRTVLEGDALTGRKTVRFSETLAPGFYRVHATDENGNQHHRPETDFAVNLDPRGSDLRPVADDMLPTSGGATIGKPAATHKRRVELWHAIAVGLLLLLLTESILGALLDRS
jgi:hypothetical protein